MARVVSPQQEALQLLQEALPALPGHSRPEALPPAPLPVADPLFQTSPANQWVPLLPALLCEPLLPHLPRHPLEPPQYYDLFCTNALLSPH